MGVYKFIVTFAHLARDTGLSILIVSDYIQANRSIKGNRRSFQLFIILVIETIPAISTTNKTNHITGVVVSISGD